MKTALLVAMRDVRSMLYSPLAYCLVSLFLCVSGYFFFNLLASFNFAVAQEAQMPIGEFAKSLNLNEWVVQGFFQTLLILLVLTTPLVTMRSLSEERESGKLLLLKSLPISSFDLFFGKFLSAAFLVLMMLTISCFLPLGLIIFSSPEVMPILTGIFGLYLAALAFVAIGVCMSGIFPASITSGVATVSLLLILYGIHMPAESFGAGGQAFFRYMSPLWQLRDLFRGVVTLAPFAYFLSLVSLALLLGSPFSLRSDRQGG